MNARAALVLLLVAPTAAALALPPSAPGSEQQLLDGYLRPHDRASDLPYCGRVATLGETPEDAPDLPARSVNGTNALMDEHMAWHMRHVHLRERAPPEDDANPYGDDFVLMHRMTLAHYDAWRVAHGAAPVRAWDPSTPIPPDFAYAPPDACQPRRSEDPKVPLPSWLTLEGGPSESPYFHAKRLCDFPTTNRLGKELDEGAQATIFDVDLAHQDPNAPGSYHGAVHDGVGGDMAQAFVSMRDPVFWAWHKWLDVRVRLWETECAHRAPLDAHAYADSMATMHPGAPPPPAASSEAPTQAAAPPETARASVPLATAGIALLAFAALAMMMPKKR